MSQHDRESSLTNRRRFAAAALALALAPFLLAGKLDDVRDAVRGDSSPSSSSSSSNDDDDDWDDDDDDHDYGAAPSRTDSRTNSGALDYLCLVPVLLPFCLPIWAIERTPFEPFDQDPFGGRFAAYPYAGSAAGHILPRPLGASREAPAPADDDPFAEEPALGRYLHLRLSGEYAYDVDGAVHRPGGAMLLDTSLRIGLESSWNVYVEPLAPNATDELTFGDVNVFFRLAQDDWAEFRLGVGANLMLDGGRVDAGFNGTFALDVFPVDPLVLAVAFDAGMLGDAFALRARGTLGIMLSRLELFAGYDVHTIDNILFHGPVAGARVWI